MLVMLRGHGCWYFRVHCTPSRVPFLLQDYREYIAEQAAEIVGLPPEGTLVVAGSQRVWPEPTGPQGYELTTGILQSTVHRVLLTALLALRYSPLCTACIVPSTLAIGPMQPLSHASLTPTPMHPPHRRRRYTSSCSRQAACTGRRCTGCSSRCAGRCCQAMQFLRCAAPPQALYGGTATCQPLKDREHALWARQPLQPPCTRPDEWASHPPLQTLVVALPTAWFMCTPAGSQNQQLRQRVEQLEQQVRTSQGALLDMQVGRIGWRPACAAAAWYSSHWTCIHGRHTRVPRQPLLVLGGASALLRCVSCCVAWNCWWGTSTRHCCVSDDHPAASTAPMAVAILGLLQAGVLHLRPASCSPCTPHPGSMAGLVPSRSASGVSACRRPRRRQPPLNDVHATPYCSFMVPATRAPERLVPNSCPAAEPHCGQRAGAE